MHLSIIIPTLEEEPHIAACLQRLALQPGDAEIIVADAGSSDNTARIARQNGAMVLHCDKKSRAYQMNCGAAAAQGDILYFVHADTLPPTSWYTDICKALNAGADMGRFRFRFASPKFLLRLNSWFTRFDKPWVSGGDQTLFIKKSLFEQLKGYNEDFILMEEYDLVDRARKAARYCVIQKDVLVSARKYDQNSWLQVQKANLTAFKMYRGGEPSERIRDVYYKMIHHPKRDA